MPSARKTLISLEATPHYHCVSRCVRRAVLCDKDKLSGRSFEHRRQWAEDGLHELADIFTIDLCAYAIASISNYYYVVLHVDQVQANKWSCISLHQLNHWKF